MRKLAPLRIGHLTIDPPIIQGGMGVRVSKSNLAAAVANEGCAGVIATVGLGGFEHAPGSKFVV
ncbi:MAG: nitronate monooxygenase, partial [Anaerohalosphaeraceae bacterium]